MTDQNWYQTENWYSPLASEITVGEIRPVQSGENSKTAHGQSKRKNHMAVRAIGLTVLILLAIVGSSVAFRGTGKTTVSELPDSDAEMPGSMEDFFAQYYESVEPDLAEVELPPVENRPDFSIAMQQEAERELSLQELYQKCASSIVSISGYEGEKIGYSWGSGVVISEDGLILTNTHVVEKCDRAVVTLVDGREFDAKLVGADRISDIAILKIDAEKLSPAELGDSTHLQVGDRVAAIGNPLGEDFRNTLTDGIISAIERGMSYQGRTMTLLQTNTAINEGNSGGALFNLSGQVIGITNMKMMSSYSSIEGIGFAIPSSTVCNVVNALVRDGEVKGRPALGITVGSIPETAKEKYDLPDGLYVSDVSEGSDAQKKGIRAGDIITAVNGTPVTTTSEISAIKDTLSVGDSMTLTVWRDGKTTDYDIVLVDTLDVYS